MAHVKNMVKIIVSALTFLDGRRKKSSTDSSSGFSQLSTRYFENIMNTLRGKRFRKSKRKNYYKIWKLFNKFFIRLDQKPKGWEHRLILYVTYLIHIRRESFTIKSYISAIRAVLSTEGIYITRESFILSALVKARKLANNTLHVRLGISKGLAHMIVDQIEKYFKSKSQPYSAAIMIGYHGLFRVRELTSGDHPILINNVFMADNKTKIQIVLK